MIPGPLRSRFVSILLSTLLISAVLATPARSMLRPQPDDLSIPVLEAKIVELQSTSSLDETTKASTIAFYRDAIDQLARANTFAQQAAEFRRLSSEAPQLLATIRTELAAPPTEPVVVVPDGAILSQLEQTLSQETAALEAARQKLAELQAETNRRNVLRTTQTDRLVKAKQELAELGDPISQSESSEIPVDVIEARASLHRARTLVLQREIESIETELASYDARRDLLPARRDRAQRRVSEEERLVAAWQTIVTTQRSVDAAAAAADAKRLRREAARQHPVLKKFAEETVVRANARVDSQNKQGNLENIAQRLVRAKAQLASLDAKYTSIRTRLTKSGLNRATGLLLRHQYEDLPDLGKLRREVESTQQMLEDLDYTLIELQEERVESGDVDRVAQALIAEIPESEATPNQAELLQVARELATARRDLLDQLAGDASNGFDKLVELNTILRQLVTTAEAYKGFIEERILWVRSIAGDRAPRLSDLGADTEWIRDAPAWNLAWSNTRVYIRMHLLTVLTYAASLLLLWLLSLQCRRWLNVLGERVGRYSTDSFRHTLSAFFLTLLIASPLAGTMLALGILLRIPENQPELVMALGTGLQTAAWFMYPLVFFRHMLRSKGLARAHFRWAKETTQPVRRNLRWFIPMIVPVVMLVAMIDAGGDEATNASLGRIFFTIELLALTVFLHRVLRPSGPVLSRFLEKTTGGWIHRLRYIWYLLAVMLPLFFAVMSWLGFHYTALQLQSRLEHSLVLALVLVVANDLLHRWLYVARRRVAVEDAKRRRAQAMADAETKAATGGGESTQATPNTIDEEKVDLPALSEQTRQIFRTAITVSAVLGLYIIWAQALPALRMFDRVQIWPTVQVVDSISQHSSMPAVSIIEGSSTPSETSAALPMPGAGAGAGLSTQSMPATDSATSTESISITLADLGLSIVILIATWIAFRNIPGMIEIVVLQRLPLDAGSRYALSTVLRYMIAIIGVAVAFQTIGLSWSKVQWLAAALTFGLAFGLQEIFANFVSGLIILAERPIRLGDTITVGGVTGTVMRIRMRATTIGDWDRKELVIPNKTFITGEVINWSLSDPTLRVKIPVGVSYSSDTDKVVALLLKIANEHKSVLQDPKPAALFKNFGDSTLDFELRVFIPNIDYFVPVRHEIHMAILKQFREADIEIAFPQRDLHVRSIGDLSKLIERADQIPSNEPPASS